VAVGLDVVPGALDAARVVETTASLPRAQRARGCGRFEVVQRQIREALFDVTPASAPPGRAVDQR
jgi:hypothetical protein